MITLLALLRISDRAYSVAAPQTWNRLPMELKLLR